jgi:hypothetical protein
MKFGICAELIAAQKFLDLDLEDRNLEEMLELQHQFAIKMKRGRHRLAEKALQKSPTQKNSKKAQSEPVPSQIGSKKNRSSKRFYKD